ncbi:MAG: ABC transporter permease, partial [Actinomycetota bacterium]
MSTIAGSHDAEFAVEVRSQWRTVVRRFLRHKLAMISLVTLTIIFLASIFGKYIWRFDFMERDTANLSQPPSWTHPFGTDSLGKDMLALTLRGAQRSILIALMVSVLST